MLTAIKKECTAGVDILQQRLCSSRTASNELVIRFRGLADMPSDRRASLATRSCKPSSPPFPGRDKLSRAVDREFKKLRTCNGCYCDLRSPTGDDHPPGLGLLLALLFVYRRSREAP